MKNTLFRESDADCLITKWKVGPIKLYLMLVFRKQNFSKGAFVVQRKFIIISYLLFLVPLIFIMNFLFDIITLEKIQGLPVFFPLAFCSIGLFFASKAYQTQKSALTIGAIIANSVLFLFPFIYMIGGTAIFGV